MYICMCVCICIYIYINRRPQWQWINAGRRAKEGRWQLSLYKIWFHFKAVLRSLSSFYCHAPHLRRLPWCNTIARPLRNIRPDTDPPFVCYTPYNIDDGNIVWRPSSNTMGYVYIYVCMYMYIYIYIRQASWECPALSLLSNMVVSRCLGIGSPSGIPPKHRDTTINRRRRQRWINVARHAKGGRNSRCDRCIHLSIYLSIDIYRPSGAWTIRAAWTRGDDPNGR